VGVFGLWVWCGGYWGCCVDAYFSSTGGVCICTTVAISRSPDNVMVSDRRIELGFGGFEARSHARLIATTAQKRMSVMVWFAIARKSLLYVYANTSARGTNKQQIERLKQPKSKACLMIWHRRVETGAPYILDSYESSLGVIYGRGVCKDLILVLSDRGFWFLFEKAISNPFFEIYILTRPSFANRPQHTSQHPQIFHTTPYYYVSPRRQNAGRRSARVRGRHASRRRS
jgi:hypothetical protein